MQYKVTLDRDTCIGTHSCTAEAPKYFKKADDGKVDLFNATFNEEDDVWELTLDDDTDLLDLQNAEDGCPVDAIEVEELS